MKINPLVFALILTIITFSCNKKEDAGPTQTINQVISSTSETLKKGNFTGYDHDLSGKSFILKDGADFILRLSDFNMTPAPDADVFLSKSASYSSGSVVKIADLPGGYANSSLNFTIPSTVDYSEYPYVIVWCTEYSVNFGVATLVNP